MRAATLMNRLIDPAIQSCLAQMRHRGGLPMILLLHNVREECTHEIINLSHPSREDHQREFHQAQSRRSSPPQLRRDSTKYSVASRKAVPFFNRNGAAKNVLDFTSHHSQLRH